MTKKLQNVIRSASQTLSFLSKIRCVESYQETSECTYKTLLSWPNQNVKDAEITSILEEKGISTDHSFRVKSLQAPYSLYEQMSRVQVPELSEIRVSRSLLDVFQIVAAGNSVTKITAVWDSNEHPNRPFPRQMSDTQALEIFARHKDSMLAIDRENEQYSIKLRAYAFRAVLAAKPELKEFEILHDDRQSFIGSKGDSRGRSDRFLVHKGNREHMSNVVHHTNESIRKLVGNDHWVKELRDGAQRYFGSHAQGA